MKVRCGDGSDGPVRDPGSRSEGPGEQGAGGTDGRPSRGPGPPRKGAVTGATGFGRARTLVTLTPRCQGRAHARSAPAQAMRGRRESEAASVAGASREDDDPRQGPAEVRPDTARRPTNRCEMRRSLRLCRMAPFSFAWAALSLVKRAALPLPCGRLRRGSGDPCVASQALCPCQSWGGTAAPDKPALADGGSACSVRTVGRKTRKRRPRARSAVSTLKEPPRRNSRAPC